MRESSITYTLDDWLDWKRERPQLSIREERFSRFKLSRALGPRGQFAVVQLRGKPASEFGFKSVAEWPGQEFDCTIAILDGILDELFAVDLGLVVAQIQFTLKKVEWHDVDSSAVAFYHWARGAVREILGRDRFPRNIKYQR